MKGISSDQKAIVVTRTEELLSWIMRWKNFKHSIVSSVSNMRITKVDIPKLKKFGLESIVMNRLNDIVIIAGKNGAGKTRLLNIIEAWTQDVKINENQNEPKVLTNYGSIPRINQIFWAQSYSSQFQHLSRNAWWKDSNALKMYARDNKNFEKMVQENYYQLDFDSDQLPTIVKFVPKILYLNDQNDLSKNKLIETANAAKSIGVSTLPVSALAYIQVLQDRWYHVTHPLYSGEEAEKEDIIRQYDELNKMFKIFLGAEILRNTNDEATIFGFPIAKSAMSDGQKVLLQFCVAFHAQVANISELIVILDEPENHLHPSVMLDVINKLKEVLHQGQIWIATHSIPLLANFDSDCIWWMDNGTVKHAGSQPETVLRGLIGDDERIEKLHDFLGLPAALAANNFAYQCLLFPNVANLEPNDPQARQIRKLILASLGDRALRILDFGAGRGRLLATMHNDLQAELKQKMDYYAFDISDQYRSECESILASIYHNDSTVRFFLNERDVFSSLKKNSIDIIIMCNVLHEIDPNEWMSLFSVHGMLQQLLKEQGFLLLVEDTEIRIGEKAHSRGFLILDTAELKTLFSITDDDKKFAVDDARGDGRLKAHCIPAISLKRISHESFRSAIEMLRRLSMVELLSLRKNTIFTYREGRKHAYYVQQFANAQLVLESLGPSPH